MSEKKKLVFATLENQGDDLLKYSRSLTPHERLRVLYELQMFAQHFRKASPQEEDKRVRVYQIRKGESLNEFYRRVDHEQRVIS